MGPSLLFPLMPVYAMGDGTGGISTGYYMKKAAVLCAGLMMLLLIPSFPMFLPILVAHLGVSLFLLYRRVTGALKGPGVLALLLLVCGIHLTAQSLGFTAGLLKRVFAGDGLPPPGNRWRAGP